MEGAQISIPDLDDDEIFNNLPQPAFATTSVSGPAASVSGSDLGRGSFELAGPSRPWLSHGRSGSGTSGESSLMGAEGSGGDALTQPNGKASSGPWAFPRKTSFASLKAAIKGGGSGNAPPSSSQLAEASSARPSFSKAPSGSVATLSTTPKKSGSLPYSHHGRSQSQVSGSQSRSQGQAAQPPSASSSSAYPSHRTHGQQASFYSEQSAGTGTGSSGAGYPAQPPLPAFPEQFHTNSNAGTSYALPLRPSESESALLPPRPSGEYLEGDLGHSQQSPATHFDPHGKYQSDGDLAGYGWVNGPSQTGPNYFSPMAAAAAAAARSASAGPSKLGTLPNGIGSPNPRTPSEYALNVLMSRYLTRTRIKVQGVLNHGMSAEPLLEQSFGHRVDEEFEALLASIAHVSRSNPKLVVESLFSWQAMHIDSPVDAETVRRAMSEAAHLNASQQSIAAAAVAGSNSNGGAQTSGIGGGVKDIATILSRRRFLACTYILSRTLIEVSKQLQPGALGESSLNSFLSNVFELLQDCSRNRLPKSMMQNTAFEEVSRLLGELSKKYFMPIGDRFISMLEHCAKLPPSKNVELSQETAVLGMRHLSITVFPMETFEEGAEFLETIARFFAGAHGQRVKCAYAETLTHLILPVAQSASAEINHPTWQKAMDIVGPRAYTMATKPRYWPIAYPLYVATLCGSSDDTFSQGFAGAGNWGWTTCLESALPRLKDRNLRPIVLNAALRLIWVYMFRCRESTTTTTKRLGAFFRQWFPATRPAVIIGAETSHAPHVAMLHLVLYRHFEFGRDLILEFLRHSALSGSTLSLQTDVLTPPRMIAAIRAVMMVLDAHVKGESPPFPSSADFGRYDLVDFNGMGDELPDSFSSPKPDIGDAQIKFNDLIGKIALICDHQVATTTVFDESVIVLRGGPVSHGVGSTIPGTQSMASMAALVDHERHIMRQHPRTKLTVAYVREQQPYVDLLRACFESWPRCLASSIPFASVLSVLFRATFSADPDLGDAASQTLRRIAQQRSNGAAAVVSGFGRFIFRTNTIFWETHPHQISLLPKVEAAVKVWLDFLNIWLGQLRASQADGEQGVDAKMERTSAWAINDEVEAYGLLLLCSGHRPLRRLAISTLRIVSILDEAFATPGGDVRAGAGAPGVDGFPAVAEPTRIIHLLDLPCRTFCNVDDSRLNADQRQKVTEWNRNNSMNPLSDLAESDLSIEHSLWQHVLPRFLRNCLERFPTTVAVFRSHVTNRLLSMDSAVGIAAGLVPRAPTMHGGSTVRSIPASPAASLGLAPTSQSTASPADQSLMTEHWKMYILALCTTTTSTEGSRGAVNTAAQWRQQQSGEVDASERVIAARDLFQKLVPFLASDQAKFREAAVMALGNINLNLYRTLLETLQSVSSQINEGGRNRSMGRTTASARRHTRLRTALAHVVQLTSSHMSGDSTLSDTAIMNLVIGWVKDTFNFLIAKEVELDWDFQLLRRYFCGVVEDLYRGLASRNECDRFFPFTTRLRMFRMFADWYAYSQSARDGPSKLANLLASVAGQARDEKQREHTITTLRDETQALSFHASDAMATMCMGPIKDKVTPTTNTPFEPTWLVVWLEGLFKSPSPINQGVARRALHAVLQQNPSNAELVNAAIVSSFHELDKLRAPQSLFACLCESIVSLNSVEVPLHHVFCLGLTKLGHPDTELRRKAFALVEWTVKKNMPDLSLHDIEVGVNSPLPATYLRAQREVSAYLAHHFSSLKVAMVCEFTLRLNVIDASRRSTTLGLLPDWLRSIDLLQGAEQAGGDNSLTYCSMLVLSNLLFLTIKHGDEHNFEIQDAWASLAEGGQILLNANAIIKFLVEQGLCYPTPSFVVQAKRVVSCLSHTIIGPLMFDELCAFIEPTTMIPVPQSEIAVQTSTAEHATLYRAALTSVLPEPSSRMVFSPGQLALLFIGELTYERSDRLSTKLPSLLHAIFVQIDSFVPFMQEQVVGMFEQLLRSMAAMSAVAVLQAGEMSAKAQVENLCTNWTFWSHDDSEVVFDEMKTPRSMRILLTETLNILQPLAPDLAEQWGNIALFWATSGPVRHLACRSFQAFRILLPFATPTMLADMLGRLSNTISDPNAGIQSFSLEILYTLTALVRWTDDSEDQQHLFSQTFWAAVACLSTVNEGEFEVAIDMLDGLLDKLDIGEPEVISLLLSKLPEGWEGERGAIQPLVLRGLRSSVTSATSFKVLSRLAKIQDCTLIDASPDDRLAFLFVNALPWFLQSTDALAQARDEAVLTLAEDIATLAEARGKADLARVASSIAKARFRTKDDLVRQAINCVRANFLPRLAPRLAVSLLGLTLNQHEWLRNQTMQVLKIFFQVVDTRSDEFARLGSELLMPLLRLLSTPLAAQALEVLDEPIAIHGGPAANQILRMSLQWGNPSRRREQASDAAIFGAPDDSGWAVANPQELTSRTRINVQAVFKMCEMTLDVAPVSMVDFVNEDYGMVEDGQDYLLSGSGAGISMSSDVDGTTGDTIEGVGLGDLVNQLQDLSSFFADDQGSAGDLTESSASLTMTEADGRYRGPQGNARVLASSGMPNANGRARYGGGNRHYGQTLPEEDEGESEHNDNDVALASDDEDEDDQDQDTTLDAARTTPLPPTADNSFTVLGGLPMDAAPSSRSTAGPTHRPKQSSGSEAFDPDLMQGAARTPIAEELSGWDRGATAGGRGGPWREVAGGGGAKGNRRSFFYRKASTDGGSGGSGSGATHSPVGPDYS
ncbi:hypothetical protein BCV69DRAFT_279866 [Microstroma glucosiphilum]|uniref:Cell morphogenesis protein n=1 Tax=Pseudomicrostroma glucosiphilum TaxID=1684307 RepID=A0A316UFG8_9BASI|nr:hypothetical protein BCV69DRAFT_279866 [Pseudomicrostroma glucosiphilum]PWN23960.1 hypothetical protein BCV69DRAFT_279866 [Pseudomicrostroma glucosiphilum]